MRFPFIGLYRTLSDFIGLYRTWYLHVKKNLRRLAEKIMFNQKIIIMKKKILLSVFAIVTMIAFMFPIRNAVSGNDWGIVDKWDGEYGYCHGNPVDCFGEIIIEN